MEIQLEMWGPKTSSRWARVAGDARLCRLALVRIADDEVLLTLAVRRKTWLLPDSYRFRGPHNDVIRDAAAMLDRLATGP